MYSVTDLQSFEHIEKWWREAQDSYSSSPQQSPVIFLIGTKIDDEVNRVVSYEQGKQLADSFGVSFFEVSSKDSTNINEAILSLIQSINNK